MATIVRVNIDKATERRLFKVIVKVTNEINETMFLHGQTKRRLQISSMTHASEFVEKVAEYVEKNFENVGNDFSKQALKMHYGAEEYRSIRGTTTAEEDKVLQKEGVPVFKVPVAKKPGRDHIYCLPWC